jgi:predicted ester cyclase
MSIKENKTIARMYHDLNPEDVETILTPDFIGRHNRSGSTWNRDQHKRYWTRHQGFQDVIHQQIAEGDWVATRFTRMGAHEGKQIELAMMHFKRFEGGQIAELWEYLDWKQLEEQI